MEKSNYHLFVRKRAELDLQEVLLYYEKISFLLPSKFMKELKEVFDLLRKNPFLFVIKYQNTRIAFLKRFPYGIHYIIEENKIHILTILHTKRKIN